MSILLTSGLGYTGSHITSKLKEKVIIIDEKAASKIHLY